MYYLIKDKIVNNKDYDLYFKEYENRKYLNFGGDSNYYQILKQSENLFDLIEEGDLIAFDYMNTGVIDIEKVCHKYKHRDGEVDISTRGYLHNNEKIQAIYKPNSKGDYIKVWEKKNND